VVESTAIEADFGFLKSADNKQEAQHLFEQLIDMENDTVSNKVKLIELMGDVFERDGVPKREIAVKLTSTIGYAGTGAVADSWIRKVATKHGWTRAYGDSNVYNSDSSIEESSETELNDKSLQKSDLDSSVSLNTFKDRTDAPYYNIRYPYWRFFTDIIEISKRCRDVLEQDKQLVEKDNGETEDAEINWGELFEDHKDMQDYYKALGDMFYNINKTAEKCMDGRQAILPFMLFPFVAKTSLTTIKHFSTKYFVKIKYLPDITTKKCTQFLKSENSKTELLSLTRQDAWKWNCIDIKCPECRKHNVDGKPITTYLQTKMYPKGTWDFVCTNWKIHKQDELHFDPDLLGHKLNMFELNSSNMSDRYLKERGVD